MAGRKVFNEQDARRWLAAVRSSRVDLGTWARAHVITARRHSVTSTYDAQDRLLTKGAASYTWDGLGGRATKTEGPLVTRYVHDGLGALQSVTLPGGNALLRSGVPASRQDREWNAGFHLGGTVSRFSWSQDLSAGLVGEVLEYRAILRISNRVSPGDCRRDARRARDLRTRFQSSHIWRHVEGFEWVSGWPGTRGPKGLCFRWLANADYQPRTLRAFVLHGLGMWEDVHALDSRGLLLFSVTHEQLVAVRVGDLGEFTESLAIGDEVDPVVVAFLKHE